MHNILKQITLLSLMSGSFMASAMEQAKEDIGQVLAAQLRNMSLADYKAVRDLVPHEEFLVFKAQENDYKNQYLKQKSANAKQQEEEKRLSEKFIRDNGYHQVEYYQNNNAGLGQFAGFQEPQRVLPNNHPDNINIDTLKRRKPWFIQIARDQGVTLEQLIANREFLTEADMNDLTPLYKEYKRNFIENNPFWHKPKD